MPAGPCSGISSATSIAWASDGRASTWRSPSLRLLRRAVEAYRLHTSGGDEIVTKRRIQPMLMQELAHALSRAERSVTRQLARAMEEEG